MAPVLIVENDQAILEGLADLLRDEGYDVETASNGAQALAFLRAGRAPAIILLDLMMPVMDGWRFREAQLRDPSIAGTPVVVLSAMDRCGMQASDLQAVAYVDKPINFTRLLDVIARHCRPA